jgi:hypothetical protein
MQVYYNEFMENNDFIDKYITKKEVFNYIQNIMISNHKNNYGKIINLNNIIIDVINKWELKYDNFGFYDDYHRGTHERLVKNVQKIIKDKITAIDIIKPHLCRWIMQSLYAPPSPGFKGGSRYLECQKHFKLLYR